MIKLKKTIFLITVVLSVFTLFSTALAEDSKGSISVTGTGSVKVKPNIATIYIGVTTDDTDAGKAQEINSAEMNNVLKVLKEKGISDKDIQTSYFSVYPKTDYSYRAMTNPTDSSVSGYTVVNSINVTVRDINKVGEILDAAIKAGANYGGNVSFSISDDSKYYAEALDLAVKNAKGKADVIAKSIGVTIGMPISITESGYYKPSIYSDYSYDSAALMKAAGTVPISQGDLEITATLNVVYEY